MKKFFVVTALCGVSFSSIADQDYDNTVGYKLYQQQRFAEAAEVFADTEWKGISFYRSAQWWRAAEAFGRSRSASSLFNLGNSYIRIGYLELALESYQQVLVMEPDHADAKYNIAVVLELLSREESDGKGQQQTNAKELARVDDDSSGEGDSKQQSGDSAPTQGQGGDNSESEKQGGQQEASGAGTQSKTTNETQISVKTAGGGDEISERQGSPTPQEEQGDNMTDSEDTRYSGERVRIAENQQIEQWLNGIPDDPGAWLNRRMAAEVHKRRRLGQLSEESRNRW